MPYNKKVKWQGKCLRRKKKKIFTKQRRDDMPGYIANCDQQS